MVDDRVGVIGGGSPVASDVDTTEAFGEHAESIIVTHVIKFAKKIFL